MNVEPSPEEIVGQKFIVKEVTHLSPDDWKKNLELEILRCTNITKRDQFGLSLEVTFKSFGEKQYFLKLPPGPVASEETPTVKTIEKHYSVMRERFLNEFEKWRTFKHIIDSCDKQMFSIARPFAHCRSTMKLNSGAEIELPGLIYEWIGGKDLSTDSAWNKDKIASSFIAFAQGLTRAVQVIHNQGVLHSFLVPRNIKHIKKDNKDHYIIVGFGYSSFCDSIHHSPILKVSDTDSCYRAPECAKTENLGALWFPVDIYSIGAILYQFVTGEVPNTPKDRLPLDVNRLKEHIYDKLSDRGNGYKNATKIFNENENILKILDRCLRYRPEDRFSCAEELIEALEIAEQATGHTSDSTEPLIVNAKKAIDQHKGTASDANSDSGVYRELVTIATESISTDSDVSSQTTLSNDKPPRLNHLFDSLLKNWADKAEKDAEKMMRGHYEIYGHRDILVTSLCRLLAGAKKGSIYRTMTFPSYWTDSNLGSNGRFLTMNKHMARQGGLHIERIFLVDKSFHELTEHEQEILEYQLEAQNSLSKCKPTGSFRVMVKELRNESELVAFEKNGKLVAYLVSEEHQNANPAPENCLCLNFVSHGNYEWLNGRRMIRHSIKKIRYWIPKKDFRKDAFVKNHTDFMSKWQNSISLEEYIGKTTTRTLDELVSNGRKFLRPLHEYQASPYAE